MTVTALAFGFSFSFRAIKTISFRIRIYVSLIKNLYSIFGGKRVECTLDKQVTQATKLGLYSTLKH